MKTKNAVKESEKVIAAFEVKTPREQAHLQLHYLAEINKKFVVGRELEDDPKFTNCFSTNKRY